MSVRCCRRRSVGQRTASLGEVSEQEIRDIAREQRRRQRQTEVFTN